MNNNTMCCPNCESNDLQAVGVFECGECGYEYILLKNEAIELCNKLIPLMNDVELGLIGFTLKQVVNRISKGGK